MKNRKKLFLLVLLIFLIISILILTIFIKQQQDIRQHASSSTSLLTLTPTPSVFPPQPTAVSCDTLTVPTGTKKIIITPTADAYEDRSAEIQAVLSSNFGKDTFCFKAGVYALGEGLNPRPDHTLIGEVDSNGNRLVTLTGAKKIEASDISKDGTNSRWIIQNQTSLGAKAQGGGKTLTNSCTNSEIGGTYTRCVYADQLFLVDSTGTKQLQHAESLASLTTGFFYWDYTNNLIYLADDPTGKTVEISRKNAGVTSGVYAIGGTAWRTSVKNLIVEKFGTPTDNPAVLIIQGGTSEGNLIRYNHAVGLRFNGADNTIRNNIIHFNGEYGIVGAGTNNGVKYTGNLIEENEIAFNNIAWYGWFHSAGGTKFNYTDGLIMRNNYVHHNIGFGLWLDAFNINALYEGNRVEYNRGGGIEHEISGNAVMHGNTAISNGYKKDGTCDMNGWFGGIRAATSDNVEIYENITIDNCFGILGVKSERGTGLDLNNLYIHDNTITQSSSNAKYVAAIRVYECPTCVTADYYDVTKKNNRFENNHYVLPTLTGNYFYWHVGPNQSAVNKDYWVSIGNDITGTFTIPSSQTTPQIQLDLLLNGIGNGGNAETPGTAGNFSPINPQRSITLDLYETPTGPIVETAVGTITFNQTQGNFTGTISLSSSLADGSYLVRIKTPRHLRRLAPGFITIMQNNSAPIPLAQTTLIVGDSNNDDSLDILDYNILADCYSVDAPPKACADSARKTSADLNDDGIVNGVDINYLIRNVKVRSGG